MIVLHPKQYRQLVEWYRQRTGLEPPKRHDWERMRTMRAIRNLHTGEIVTDLELLYGD